MRWRALAWAIGGSVMLAAGGAAADRLGIAPIDPWTCPASHPIKGYLSQGAGRVYHLPGGRFYEEASPERCYASEDEARRDGSVPARDPRLAPGSRDVVSARSPDPRGCPTRSTTRHSS